MSRSSPQLSVRVKAFEPLTSVDRFCFLFLAEVAREAFFIIFFVDFCEAKSSSDELSGHCVSEVLDMVSMLKVKTHEYTPTSRQTGYDWRKIFGASAMAVVSVCSGEYNFEYLYTCTRVQLNWILGGRLDCVPPNKKGTR